MPWRARLRRAQNEVVSALDHGGQHRLHDRVVGIDELVIRLESVEMKAKLDRFEGSVAKQAMAETEAGAGYVRRDRLFGAQRQETAPAFPFFDHPQGEAGRIG